MRSDPFLLSFADAVRNFNYRRMRQVMEVESHGSQTVRSGGTQELFTKLRTEPTLESSSFRGRADQTKTVCDSIESRALSCVVRGEGHEFVSRKTERAKHSNRTRISSWSVSSCGHRKLLSIFPLFSSVSILHTLTPKLTLFHVGSQPTIQSCIQNRSCEPGGP
jgi:hypothetical protein